MRDTLAAWGNARTGSEASAATTTARRETIMLDHSPGIDGTAASYTGNRPGRPQRFEDHVREAVLDHKPGGMKRVYDLHLYYAEKLALLTAWEERLFSIVEPAAGMMEAAE